VSLQSGIVLWYERQLRNRLAGLAVTNNRSPVTVLQQERALDWSGSFAESSWVQTDSSQRSPCHQSPVQAVAGPLHQRVANVRPKGKASDCNVWPARKLLPVVLGQLLPAIQDSCKGDCAGPGLDLQTAAATTCLSKLMANGQHQALGSRGNSHVQELAVTFPEYPRLLTTQITTPSRKDARAPSARHRASCAAVTATPFPNNRHVDTRLPQLHLPAQRLLRTCQPIAYLRASSQRRGVPSSPGL
jgi:hypothetical protein